MLRAATLAGFMLLLACGAAAQGVDYSLDATVTFYGDNTEFFNPFRKGETILGAPALVGGEARTSDRLAIRARLRRCAPGAGAGGRRAALAPDPGDAGDRSPRGSGWTDNEGA
ncbi:MAG: hypothetical protein A3J29_17870 [Acidobacteria bacterium RIFCSPLOWO2_12_FULL_67_14b]|nr:MAG: hypothetical protein A3J29_17870 [Acidobacteria bacterium RIFCSPLOWO2_12_FULL_67_14b]